MRPVKTQISLRIRAVWSESSLSAWGNFAILAIQNALRGDSDQTARMHMVIWIFAGRICPKDVFWRFNTNNYETSQRTTKPTKWHVRPAKTQISLGIRPGRSVSSQSAWRKNWPLATHWVHSEDCDQTESSLGAHATLLVLSCAGSNIILQKKDYIFVQALRMFILWSLHA